MCHTFPFRWPNATSVLPYLALFSSTIACSEAASEEAPTVLQELRSDAPRATEDASAAQVASRDQNALGWALFGDLAGDENLVFSPMSIATSGAMLGAAAAGDTLTQLLAAHAFSIEGQTLHAAQNGLALALEARNHEADEERRLGAQVLRSSNDLWIRPHIDPSDAFLDTLATYYGSGVHLADFEGAPDAVREAINAHVSEETEGLIDELLSPGDIGEATAFVLTNALYFEALWAQRFSPEATAPASFARLSGGTTEVPMMRHWQGDYRHAAGDGLQALAIPFARDELELIFVLPDEGEFEAVRATLDAERIEALVADLEQTPALLWVPRFQVDTNLPLESALRARGMVDAFDPTEADFSRVGGGLYLDRVVHRATFLVDEEGASGAAATAAVVNYISAPLEPVEFHADRPFVFFVRDRATGAALFIGQYVEP